MLTHHFRKNVEKNLQQFTPIGFPHYTGSQKGASFAESMGELSSWLRHEYVTSRVCYLCLTYKIDWSDDQEESEYRPKSSDTLPLRLNQLTKKETPSM